MFVFCFVYTVMFFFFCEVNCDFCFRVICVKRFELVVFIDSECDDYMLWFFALLFERVCFLSEFKLVSGCLVAEKVEENEGKKGKGNGKLLESLSRSLLNLF